MIVENTPIGWLCPRCKRVWSPDVLFCDCTPKEDAPSLKPPATVMIGVLPVAAAWYATRTEQVCDRRHNEQK